MLHFFCVPYFEKAVNPSCLFPICARLSQISSAVNVSSQVAVFQETVAALKQELEDRLKRQDAATLRGFNKELNSLKVDLDKEKSSK